MRHSKPKSALAAANSPKPPLNYYLRYTRHDAGLMNTTSLEVTFDFLKFWGVISYSWGGTVLIQNRGAWSGDASEHLQRRVQKIIVKLFKVHQLVGDERNVAYKSLSYFITRLSEVISEG